MASMTQIAERDFSRATLRALARRGVVIVSSQFHPDGLGSATGETSYLVAVNGHGRVCTRADVMELAQ